MNHTTRKEATEDVEEPVVLEALSVYRACEQITDGRAKRGVRYSVAFVVTLILLGKLAGMTTPEAIAEWVQWRADWLKQVLPMPRESFPCASTYRNVLRVLDAAQVNQVLSHLLIRAAATKRCGEEPSRLVGQVEREEHVHVALDGKTLRGTLGHLAADQQKMHQVGLYETRTGVLLKEQVVAEKENELSQVSEFLTPLWVKGRLISADALHTQHAFCTRVVAAGGDYLLFAKGNQPTLREDLRLFFREPPLDCRDWRKAETVNKGHGRLEMRQLLASTELNDFLATTWTGVEQVFCLRRRVQKALVCTQETIYGFTSLTPAQAGPDRLLELIREHWAIENRLHWRRDVTLREDQCQVRKGDAPRVLAVLNSFLLGLLDLLGISNVARQMRLFDARPLQAVQLLLGRL
jgi:predicted transposase YbfD/YdcC